MKLIKLLLVGILLLPILACNKGKNNSSACNGSSTRRDIKLVIDPDAEDVDTIPIIATVDSLGAMDVIQAKKKTPRQDVEKLVFSVTGKISKIGKHRDGDYKLKFESENEKYLNCEAPNPGCEYAVDSRFYEEFKEVYEWIEENENSVVGKTVTITGVGFLDVEHNYPRNAAENDIELHPILDIHY